MRNFSRLDESERKEVNIHEGIDSTLLILVHRLRAKLDRPDIELIKEYGDLPLVECYPGQLNQVFMNVISNAIDALHQRDKERSIEGIRNNPSTITINTSVLNREQTYRDVLRDRVRISIKDNGLGISDEVKTQLFNPFFTTKPVGEGTGLGLSISYQIVVEKHGGQMKCISQLGQGAEFQIDIPLAQS